MMMRNRTIGIILLLLTAISVSAQKAERDYIRKGNRAYKDSTYVNAEVNYRKAIDVNPKSAISMYNLGNTLMQQNKLQEAMEQFVAATKMEKDKGNLAQIYHNMGVYSTPVRIMPKLWKHTKSHYVIIRKITRRVITWLWLRKC